jgi:pimeloyl-ACP methyl ester carboxylesterase
MSLGATPKHGFHDAWRRLRAVIGAAGGTAGVLIGIYSDQVRSVIAWTWQHGAVFTASLLAVGAVGVMSWEARGLLERRRFGLRHITAKSLEIRATDLEGDLPNDQAVFGRELRYLERLTGSRTLVILLHGIGLDADDFRPFMHVTGEHTAALTLFGFNASEANDPRYRPIGLTTHAELVNGAINHIHRQYPDKRLLLVGFSVGADLLLRLGELWKERPARKPDLAGLLLLDPNINHSSMVLSGAFATMDPNDPLTALKRIAQIPSTLVEFENLTEYLHKITRKDPAQIKQHAKDWWDYWEPDGQYGRFFERVDNLRTACANVKIFFSVHYEQHFNELLGRARQRGQHQLLDLLRIDHFELIGEDFLVAKVTAVKLAAKAP